MKKPREIEINEIVKQHTGYDVDFQYHKPKFNNTTFIINNVDCSHISQEKIQDKN